MSTLWRFVGLIIVGWMVLWGTGSASQFGIFINVPSLMLVGGIIVGGLCAGFGPSMVVRAFKRALIERGEAHPQHAAVMARGYQLAWAAGIIGTFTGMIQMLANLDYPSMIGPGMAVALLCTLYGALIAELLFGLLQQSLMNQDKAQASDAQPSTSMLGKGTAALFLILFAFMVLFTALADLQRQDHAADAREPKDLQRPASDFAPRDAY